MFTDNVCLMFDPKSPFCAKDFSFFVFNDWNLDVSPYTYSYLALAPLSELNGPSFVQSLNATGVMLNTVVSWQFGNWETDNNNITFGGDIVEAYAGTLHTQKILADSLWIWNVNT